MEDGVLEVIEETVDALAKQKAKFALVLTVGSVAGIVVGSFAGYRTAIKVLEPKYAAIADEEIAEAKRFYGALHKRGDLETPEKAAKTLLSDPPSPKLEAAAEALTRYQGSDDEQEAPKAEVIEINTFVESHTDFEWDYEAEVSRRNPEEPYVIHEDEWSEGKTGYTRANLTWYAGDSTLADEADEAIPIVDDVVGLDNLERFGHGTGDSRVVFVRNERLTIDFEIAKHDGKFAHEVLGFQHGELLASRDNRNGIRKFRGDHE